MFTQPLDRSVDVMKMDPSSESPNRTHVLRIVWPDFTGACAPRCDALTIGALTLDDMHHRGLVPQGLQE